MQVVSEPSVGMKSVDVLQATLGPLVSSFGETVRPALTEVFSLSSSSVPDAVLPQPWVVALSRRGGEAGWQACSEGQVIAV